MDPFLLRHAPGAPIPLAQCFMTARRAVAAATDTLLGIPDEALERPWPFNDGEIDVRYGFYRAYEMLEAAAIAARRALDEAGVERAPAQPIVAEATTARWELHGLLAGLDDDALDRDPGGDQWTARQTLAHVVNTQRAYGWFTAWWLSRRDVPADDFPPSVPDDLAAQLPDDDSEGAGTLSEIRARLDTVLDDSAAVLGRLDADALAVRARWAGVSVDVGFRLARWSSHIREHTVQVEKTLASNGYAAREVDRLLRLIVTAYGRLESTGFGLSDDTLAPASAVIQAVAASVVDTVMDVRAAAERPSGAASSAGSGEDDVSEGGRDEDQEPADPADVGVHHPYGGQTYESTEPRFTPADPAAPAPSANTPSTDTAPGASPEREPNGSANV